MAKNDKARHWTFILYPESAPDDWKDRLIQLGIEFAVSPLHDKDLNPTGEVKKSHYHILLSYGNTTTYNNIKSICDDLNCPIPQKVANCKGMIRYFIHLDNPEKYQYNMSDIQVYNGFDLADLMKPTSTDKYNYKFAIIDICKSEGFIHYTDLIIHLRSLDEELAKVAIDSPKFCEMILKDNFHQYNKNS